MTDSQRCQLCNEPTLEAYGPEPLALHQKCVRCGLVQKVGDASDQRDSAAPQAIAIRQRDEVQRQAEQTFAQIAKLMSTRVERPRLLQVECQLGHVLHVARQRGWQAVGVEQRRKAVEFCRSRNLDVYHAGASKLPFPNESFDIVYASDVLEWVDDAGRSLREWKRVLRPGGLLFVTAANVDSSTHALASRRASSADAALPNYGFTDATLTRLVKRSGLECLDARARGPLSAASVFAAIGGTIDQASRLLRRRSAKDRSLTMFAIKPKADGRPAAWTVQRATKAA